LAAKIQGGRDPDEKDGCKDTGWQRPTERLLSRFLASNEPLSVGIFGN